MTHSKTQTYSFLKGLISYYAFSIDAESFDLISSGFQTKSNPLSICNCWYLPLSTSHHVRLFHGWWQLVFACQVWGKVFCTLAFSQWAFSSRRTGWGGRISWRIHSCPCFVHTSEYLIILVLRTRARWHEAMFVARTDSALQNRRSQTAASPFHAKGLRVQRRRLAVRWTKRRESGGMEFQERTPARSERRALQDY